MREITFRVSCFLLCPDCIACVLTYCCERFEPRSHFIRRWSMIVGVSVIPNRTVVDSDCQ